MSALPSTARYGPRELALLFTLASMWGLTFLFIEVALTAVAPIWIVVARTSIGALVLLAVVAVRRAGLPRRPADWLHLAALGVMNNAVPWTAVAYAQQSLESGQTGLLMALVPTSTLLVSMAAGLERPNGLRTLGILVALGGVGLIVADDLGDTTRVTATLVVLASTVLYACGAVYAKRTVSGRLRPLPLACGQVLSATVLWIPVALVVAPPPGAEVFAPSVAGALAALGALSTGMAFLVFYTLVERVGPTNATLVTYLVPVIAVVAGVLLLDETLGWLVIGGGLLVGFGIWLSQRALPPAVRAEGNAAATHPIARPGPTLDHD